MTARLASRGAMTAAMTAMAALAMLWGVMAAGTASAAECLVPDREAVEIKDGLPQFITYPEGTRYCIAQFIAANSCENCRENNIHICHSGGWKVEGLGGPACSPAGVVKDSEAASTAGIASAAEYNARIDDIVAYDALDSPPEALQQGGVYYPQEAWDKNIEGSIAVDYVVRGDGTVVDVQVAESTPPGVFDSVVLNAVRTWLYRPAMKDGVPVATRKRFEVDFKKPEETAEGGEAKDGS